MQACLTGSSGSTQTTTATWSCNPPAWRESQPPRPAPVAVALETVRRIVDEAVALGFQRLFFTGGEPFILDGVL